MSECKCMYDITVCVRVCLSVFKLHILLLLCVWRCWFSLVDPVFPAVPVWFSATNEPSGALTINPTSPGTITQNSAPLCSAK